MPKRLPYTPNSKVKAVRMDNANRNKTTLPHADMEPSARHEPLGAQKIKRLDSPCHIHCHSRRHRLADFDGVCYKYVIDGLVHAGLLQDDSPEWVEKVSYSQEKISRKEQEETIIIIECHDKTKQSK